MDVTPFVEGGDEIGFPVIETEVVEGSGAQNLRNLAANEFTGCDLANLIADCHAPAGCDQFFDIVSRGMVGDAAHRSRAAFREGHIQNT